MIQSDSAAIVHSRELARLPTDALREFRDRERVRIEATLLQDRAAPLGAAFVARQRLKGPSGTTVAYA